MSTQTNYTCTYLSQHLESRDENSVYRYLKSEKLTPTLIWEKAQKAIDFVEDAYIIFDDTVLSKIHSNHIEGVRSQYSSNAKGLIKSIGVVTCLYYNPIMDEYAVIDFRIFDPDRDAKSKLKHAKDILKSLKDREVSYKTVLMDTWYATRELILLIDKTYEKVYYSPLRKNRKVT